ncbi:MAG: DUF2779 domain-containing protein [Bacteroidetes bacterium]|nr:MAG: DUF2779 domain-containing protein [Bacteroidota bacterium]
MISKSKYVQGIKCQKALWLSIHKPKLQNEITPSAQARFDAGNEVGELALQLYPDGKKVEFDPSNNFSKMLEKTGQLIAAGEDTIYEATFSAKGALAMVDIMYKTSEGWDIYEVKSSGSVKSEYYHDTAIQWFILNAQLEIKINKIYIVHLDTGYSRKGDLDVEQLFTKVDVTEKVKEKQAEVESHLTQFLKLETSIEPIIDVGAHCKKNGNGECFYTDHCWKHIPTPSVFDINGHILNLNKKLGFYQQGFIKIADVSSDMDSSAKLNMIVSSHIKNETVINKKAVNGFIDKIQYPISFFDFETFTDEIPYFDNQNPFEVIPFQYSLHIMNAGKDIEHKEFLGDEHTDPRKALVHQMLNDFPETGSIVAANASYEKRMIRELAAYYPKFNNQLLALNERFVDIQTPFKQLDYCHPDLHGKYSMKLLLPALFPDDPELDYKKLEIQGGGDAMLEFPNLRKINDKYERERIRGALLKYCKLDTYGMVKVFEKLRDI